MWSKLREAADDVWQEYITTGGNTRPTMAKLAKALVEPESEDELDFTGPVETVDVPADSAQRIAWDYWEITVQVERWIAANLSAARGCGEVGDGPHSQWAFGAYQLWFDLVSGSAAFQDADLLRLKKLAESFGKTGGMRHDH